MLLDQASKGRSRVGESGQDLKILVQEFWEQVFNEGQYAIIDKTLSAAYVFNGDPQTPAGVQAWVESLRAAMPDMHFDIDDLLGDGDKVAIRWTLVGTDAKTKTKVTTSGTNIITFAGGQAISNWQNGGTPADVHPLG
jgi:predicted ester cyclase